MTLYINVLQIGRMKIKKFWLSLTFSDAGSAEFQNKSSYKETSWSAQPLKYTVYLFLPQHISGIGQRFHGNCPEILTGIKKTVVKFEVVIQRNFTFEILWRGWTWNMVLLQLDYTNFEFHCKQIKYQVICEQLVIVFL